MSFKEGIQRNAAEAMFNLDDVPDVFVNGVPVSNIGQVATDAVAAIATFSGGLPLTAAGRLAIVVALPNNHQNGWPMALTGKIASGVGPVATHSNGIPLNAAGSVVFDATAP